MRHWMAAVVAVVALICGAWATLGYSYSLAYWNVDFCLRYNETLSVLGGVDPYLIWKGIVVSDMFVPWHFRLLPCCQVVSMVHVYPPWAYAVMTPFALLDRECAAAVYRGLQFACLYGVFAFVLLRLRRQSGCWWWPCVGFAMLCVAASAGFVRCLIVGNYGIVVTAAAFGALWAHERGRDDLAGFCWFAVLLKPQLGGLFLLTLLLERKWRALAVTAFVLMAATLCVSFMCDRNPITMLINIGEVGLKQFPGTGLLPSKLYYPASARVGERVVLAVCAFIGSSACGVCWWFLRRHASVWVRFLPAAVLSVVWSTWRLHDFSIHLMVGFVVLTLMWRARGWYFGMLSALAVSVAFRMHLISNIELLVISNYVSIVLLVVVSAMTMRWAGDFADNCQGGEAAEVR